MSIIVYKMFCDVYKRFMKFDICVKVRYVIYAKHEQHEFVTTIYLLYLIKDDIRNLFVTRKILKGRKNEFRTGIKFEQIVKRRMMDAWPMDVIKEG